MLRDHRGQPARRLHPIRPVAAEFRPAVGNTPPWAAAGIGCGACVTTGKNASAMLFVAAKVSHLALLPPGKPERERRALAMVRSMVEASFGNGTVTGSCEAVCPKEISLSFIAKLNREFGWALLKGETRKASTGGAG